MKKAIGGVMKDYIHILNIYLDRLNALQTSNPDLIHDINAWRHICRNWVNNISYYRNKNEPMPDRYVEILDNLVDNKLKEFMVEIAKRIIKDNKG